MEKDTMNIDNQTEMTVKDWYTYLKTLSAWKRELHIHIVIFLLLISIVGIVGNSIVCYIYRSKSNSSSSTKWFIFCLAVIDLCTCLVTIPVEITVLLIPYTFEHGILCELEMFFDVWSFQMSGLLLLIIAIDRYRKVCKPTSWQINVRKARILSAATVLFTFIVSVPMAWMYGYATKTYRMDNSNLTGQSCGFYIKDTFSIAYVICTTVFFVAYLVSICSLYCLIAVKIRQRICKQKMDLKPITGKSYPNNGSVSKHLGEPERANCQDILQNASIQPRDFGKESETRIEQPTPAGRDEVDAENEADGGVFSDTISRDKLTQDLSRTSTCNVESTASARAKNMQREGTETYQQKKTPRTLQRAKVRKATTSMFLISLVFVATNFSLLSLLLVVALDKTFKENISDAEKKSFKFFLRLCFLNYAINPFLYAVSDFSFRQSCRDVLSEVCRRGRTLLNNVCSGHMCW